MWNAIEKFLDTQDYKILHLRFKEIADRDIMRGQYIVIFNEILARKISSETYKVWTKLPKETVEQIADAYDKYIEWLEMTARKEELRMKELVTQLDIIHKADYKPVQKYVWTPHGRKRNRPWNV